MTPTSTTFERFTAAIGEKLREVSTVDTVFYERSREAGFPRICYTATVWTSDSTLRGTLSCTISGNGLPSEVDHIAQTLLDELDVFSSCSDELTYYLYNGRTAPVEDSDKSVTIRLLTFEFLAMGG